MTGQTVMMANHPTLYILRHGETEWNRDGRCQGHLDAPLTDLGHEQARVQGQILRAQVLPGYPDIQIHVSPLGRTRTTWGVAAAAAGLSKHPITIEPRLAEVHMGLWQGRLRADFLAEDTRARALPNLFEVSLAAPGGEGFEALKMRVTDYLAGLTQPTICVTHGITSLLLRGLVRGLTRAEMAGQGHDQGMVYRLKNGSEEKMRAVTQD